MSIAEFHGAPAPHPTESSVRDPEEDGRGIAEHLVRFASGQQESFTAYFIVDDTLFKNQKMADRQFATHEAFRKAIGLGAFDPLKIMEAAKKEDVYELELSGNKVNLKSRYICYDDGAPQGVIYEPVGKELRIPKYTRGKLAAAIIAISEV